MLPAGSLRVSLIFNTSPKIEDPPQEEWGIKGVDRLLGDSFAQHLPLIFIPRSTAIESFPESA